MWETERDFSQYILHKIAEGVRKTRIESHGTKSGIPDAYISTENVDFWIEFKNMKNKSIHDKQWKVQWRPGQQDWLVSNKTKQFKEFVTVSKCNFTIIGCKDGIIVCRMFHRFFDNIVQHDSYHVYTLSDKGLSHMKPTDFTLWLKYHCYYLSMRWPLRLGNFTIRGAVKQLLLEYLLIFKCFTVHINKLLDDNVIERRTDDILENCKIENVTQKMSCMIQNDDVINMQIEALDMAAHLLDYDAKENDTNDENED